MERAAFLLHSKQQEHHEVMKDHSAVRKTACRNCSIPHSISGCFCFLFCFLFFLSRKAKTHSLPALSHKLTKTVAILECGCGLRYLAIEYLWQEATDYQLPIALQNKIIKCIFYCRCFCSVFIMITSYSPGQTVSGLMYVLPCKIDVFVNFILSWT